MKKLIFFLPLFTTCSLLFAQETVTVQDVQAELAKAKAYTLVFFTKGSREEKQDEANAAQAMHMQHLQYLFTLKKNNVLSVFGPLTDNGNVRGILIFNSTDQAEVKKHLDADPYIKAGYMAYEIHPWFGVPGHSLSN